MVGRCDNCGRHRPLRAFDTDPSRMPRWWICDDCADKVARGRASVERYFNRRRAA